MFNTVVSIYLRTALRARCLRAQIETGGGGDLQTLGTMIINVAIATISLTIALCGAISVALCSEGTRPCAHA
eukprot:3263835-Pleurochrysis_carterae.AAC.4